MDEDILCHPCLPSSGSTHASSIVRHQHHHASCVNSSPSGCVHHQHQDVSASPNFRDNCVTISRQQHHHASRVDFSLSGLVHHQYHLDNSLVSSDVSAGSKSCDNRVTFSSSSKCWASPSSLSIMSPSSTRNMHGHPNVTSMDIHGPWISNGQPWIIHRYAQKYIIREYPRMIDGDLTSSSGYAWTWAMFMCCS